MGAEAILARQRKAAQKSGLSFVLKYFNSHYLFNANRIVIKLRC